MRKLLIGLAVTGALAGPATGLALADVSTSQSLPAAACNQGTANAHESVPANTGAGNPVFAHNAIPGTANVTPCGHGG
jgi:hypothetical protein